jgi:hypothetical protein
VCPPDAGLDPQLVDRVRQGGRDNEREG